VKVEWGIVGVIAGWGLTIILYIISVIRGRADKNESKVDKIEDKREVLQQSHFSAQMTVLSKDIESNHKQGLLIFEQLKEGQARIKEDLKERKDVSAEKAQLITHLTERVTKLEGRVDKVEGMVDDIREIKELVKEMSTETKDLIKENRDEVKTFSDEIGKIKISMFNAGIK
jgi:methyl-accepting chemotaxis protein